MSYEAEIAALLAVPAVTGLLTGGIYQAGQLTPEGITRETTPTAFDANGLLLPIALVRQRDLAPTFQVVDYDTLHSSVRAMVEVWLYQWVDYAVLDQAVPLVVAAVHGKTLTNSFEVMWAFTVDRQRDTGQLSGASLVRLDFQVDAVFHFAPAAS